MQELWGCVRLLLFDHSLTPELLLWRKVPLQKSLASELGADIVVEPRELKRAVRSVTGCRMIGNSLSGGADVTIDAVGSAVR